MYKTEIICSGCDSHYIVVTQLETGINYCPFCSEPYSDEDEEIAGDVDLGYTDIDDE